ncbi:MAG: tetratricopeptide repeat protein [Oligoflexia bacterium]|nr:tetratricopeptide repeat protein [Oligoflexia bacterium]
MNLLKSLVIVSFLLHYACDTSEVKTYYGKAKKSLGLNDTGSFLISYYDAKQFDTSFESEFSEEEIMGSEPKTPAEDKKAEKAKTEVAATMSGETEIAHLRAEVELLRFENDRLRLATGAGGKSVESVTRAPASLSYPHNSLNPMLLGTEPVKQYREAEKLFKEGRINEARIKFSEFVEAFPYTDYTSVSYFWLGEIAMMNKDYITAVDSYGQSASLSLSRQRQSINFLKIATAYRTMGREKLAAGYLKKVLNIFPDSKYGEMALKELSK